GRSDVFKEPNRQNETLERIKGEPAVDKKRLDALIHNPADSRLGVHAMGPQFLKPLKHTELLTAIKHRSAIQAGTCEFDLPLYSQWLRYPYERRARDLGQWIDAIRPVCDAVVEILWLTRESAAPKPKVAINGMYQYNVQKGANCRLLRVSLPEGSPLFPE